MDSGDLVDFHPHLQALLTDGGFGPMRWFVAFPKMDLCNLEHVFRHRVLQMLLRERRIDAPVIRTRLGWRHSGFSLRNAVRIGSDENEGRRALWEYILRSPFSQEKLWYQTKPGSVIYLSTRHPVLKRNFEVFSAYDWLAALTAHIPNAGEHRVRDSGWYRNGSLGEAPEGAGGSDDGPRGIQRAIPFRGEACVGAAHHAGVRGGSPRVSPVRGSHADPRVYRAARGHREDPDSPGILAHPHPQPAGGGTRCHILCNGSHCRLISCPWLRRGRPPGAVPPWARRPPEPIRLATLSP